VKIFDRKQAEHVVRSHGWLSEIDRAFQDQVLAKCDLLRIGAKQNVYEVGDEPGGLFGLVTGRVELHLGMHGLEPTLAYIGGPGFWAGDAAAVRGHRRIVSVVATSRCQMFRLTRADLHRMGSSSPVLWAHLAKLLARNLARALSVIDALKRNDPDARVAAMLVNLLEELPQGHVVIDASQTDIAAMAHLGRGSVNAALKNLQTRGIIRRRYASIEVTKANGLRHFAERMVEGPRVRRTA
jgi:CRP/FNR family transcriptional regulator, cyclic AMP receptor protein